MKHGNFWYQFVRFLGCKEKPGGVRVGGQNVVERWVKTNVVKMNTCHMSLDNIFLSFVESRGVFCRLRARFGKSSRVISNIDKNDKYSHLFSTSLDIDKYLHSWWF